MDSNRTFELASIEEDLNSAFLRDWFGRRYQRRLVSKRGTVWFVKCKSVQERRRDRLAALLGQGRLNIAAVESVGADSFRDLLSTGIELPNSATHENTYLVRFGLDYKYAELPLKDPDLALAAELAFSLWIRRRDAHSFNRVYQAGLPVFFDCGVAFLGEPALADLQNFFRPGADPGYAGLWRIKPVRHAELDTLTQRQRELDCFSDKVGSLNVFLPAVSRSNFFEALHVFGDRISKFDTDWIRQMIELAGYDCVEGNSIFEFLDQSRSHMQVGVERLCSTLEKPH